VIRWRMPKDEIGEDSVVEMRGAGVTFNSERAVLRVCVEWTLGINENEKRLSIDWILVGSPRANARGLPYILHLLIYI
jgi:hypothetical protein